MTVLWRYHLAHEFPAEVESLRAEFPNTRQIVAGDREQFRSALPHADVVAERALGLALATAGRVVEFHNGLRKGLWSRRAGDPAQIFEHWMSLQGKRCVSVGVGRIGCRIAELMKEFNCRFTGVGRGASVPDSTNRDRGPFDEIKHSLLSALDGAEVVFLALPLTPDTEGLIGPRELEAMDGAILNL